MSLAPSIQSSVSTIVDRKSYLPWRMEEEDAEILEDQIRFITRNNEFLAFENALLSAFVNQNTGSISYYGEMDLSGTRNRRRKRKFKPYITFPQRLEIVTRVIESYRDDIVKVEESSERMKEKLTCILKASQERIGEIKNEAFQFKKECLPIDHLKPHLAMRSNHKQQTTIQAEKMIRYYESLIKLKTNKIEKIRLGINSDKSHIAKLSTQIAQKQRFGETFQRIDFEELKIEKRHFEDNLQKKNSELLNLKLIASNSVTQLQDMRDSLMKLDAEANSIKNNIKSESNFIAKMNNEIKSVLNDNEKLRQKLKVLKLQTDQGNGPTPEDYRQLINIKADLEKQIKTLQRKVNIQRGASTSRRTQTARPITHRQLNSNMRASDWEWERSRLRTR
eukprot:TRINITY_DN2417_c0_g1_i1.p1 TRINITY_DN2417_c0_g1~~TRINITY_DN2417_c0_g1_i1.p1  ORF type:complete len:392 (-),score=18.73 TRINITY_DN2417_c0_g1_i1:198-1373(-)